MKSTITFDQYLDGGELGDLDCSVTASVYFPRRETEDDYTEIEILSCTFSIGKNSIDLLPILSQGTINTLEEKAGETAWDAAAEAAACAAEARYESQCDDYLCGDY